MEWFVDPSVNQEALNRFFDVMNSENYEVHTLQIYKGDHQLLRIAQDPYSCTDAREVYSLSKMFASTVVGIAVDMGFVRVDDRLVDIFHRENASEKFSHLTLKHLLSMNTGHDRCVMPDMCFAESSVEGFFSVEPVYEPGTHFTYNTGASCMLCSVVEKVTGMDFFDFACAHLFYPMGITNVSWNRCHDGVCCGGVGLHVSNDDIMKLGLMYSHNGVYNGRRILSESWVREASSYVSDNSANGNPDWCAGYGYQIWLNSRDGYRGDGAFGQLCMILPEHDMVVAVQAIGNDMQSEIDHVSELVDDLIGCGGERKVYSYVPLTGDGEIPAVDAVYRLDENPADFRTVWMKSDQDSVQLVFSDGAELQTVSAKIGCWTVNKCAAKHMTPTLYGLEPTESKERITIAASCAQVGEKTVICQRYRNNPHTEHVEITLHEDRIRIQYVEPWGRDLRPANMKYLTGTKI